MLKFMRDLINSNVDIHENMNYNNSYVIQYTEKELYEMKVGQIARTVLMKLLIDGVASEREIELMQTSEYSKRTFDLQYPLLIKVRVGEPRQQRYYAQVLNIYGDNYRMCSEWYETKSNDDKTPLICWIMARTRK